MAKRIIRKTVAVHLLEAVRSALEFMSQARMELGNSGSTSAAALADLTHGYREVRRIRDYLRSRISAGGRDVSWDLSKADENLLVSCLAHALRQMDDESSARGIDADVDLTRLRQKRDLIVSCAVALATEPLADLPAPTGGRYSAGFQKLRKKIQEKVGGGAEATLAIERFDRVGTQQIGTAAAAPPAAEEPALPTDEMLSAAAEPPHTRFLMDPRSLRDPRLRIMSALDQAALKRALDARDHRLAAVHLASVLEGAMLDYVLSRRRDLGVSGTPDSWNLQELILTHLQGNLSPQERGSMMTLCGVERVLRPVRQYTQPTVVTEGAVSRHLEFVKKVLIELGYRGTNDPAAQTGEARTSSHGFGELPRLGG